MVQERVIIILGSGRDEEFARPIYSTMAKLGITCEMRVSSAHKTPDRLLDMLKKYDSEDDNIVFITVAGRSNALSGFVDANTRYPVIACPPLSEKFSEMDIFSSLRMPSGVTPLVVLEPENAALAAAKILALSNHEISRRIHDYQQEAKNRVVTDDTKLRKKE